jgi:hypothetical protein
MAYPHSGTIPMTATSSYIRKIAMGLGILIQFDTVVDFKRYLTPFLEKTATISKNQADLVTAKGAAAA